MLFRLFSLFKSAQNSKAKLQQAGAAVRKANTSLGNLQERFLTENFAKAEAGDPDAQFDLAERFYNGLGFPQDYALAAHWFLLAAQQGHAQARTNLALMLFLGRGVARNRPQAWKWIRLASQQQLPAAQKLEQKLRQKLSPPEIAAGESLLRAGRP